MAGDWIKMRCELQTHPKIVRILSAMRLHDVQIKTDKFRVIGGLHSVWSVFDTHSVDGVLFGYTPETLDHVIGLEGFSSAMIAVGWLVYDGSETLTLPEFDEHNGQSAKRRAEDQKRKRNGRKSESCPQSVRNLSADEAEKSPVESGLEKRREEKKEPIDARASRLPESWIPDEDDIEFCVAERPDLDVSSVADQFRDYWVAQPGAKGRKLDWRATWRNWVRNQKRGFQNGHQGNTKGLVL